MKITKDSFGSFEHKSFLTLWLKFLEQIPRKADVDQFDPEAIDEVESKGLVDSVKRTNSDGMKVDKSAPSESSGMDFVDPAGPKDSDKKPCMVDEVEEVDKLTSGVDLNQSESGLMDAAAIDEDLFDGGTKERKAKKSKSEKIKERKQIKKRASIKRRNTLSGSDFRHHPDLLSLQSKLEDLYPYCKDQSQISPLGFQPHLSLGQFSRKDIVDFMEQFKEDWVDLEFEVNEICLISREDFDDPFHVRHRVKLGCGLK